MASWSPGRQPVPDAVKILHLLRRLLHAVFRGIGRAQRLAGEAEEKIA